MFFLSLLLAFSIWMIHNLSLGYSDFITSPTRVSCNLEGHAPVSANSCDVVARCRTSGYNILKAAYFGGGGRVIDVPKSELHHQYGEIYYITKEQLNEYAHLIYGEKVNVEYFISDTLFYRFPFENHKKVPVHPVHILNFAPQYMSRGRLAVEPDSVIIYGDPLHLNNVDRVFTETIKLDNLKSGTAGVAKIEKIKGLRISDETVHYNIDVSRFVEVKTEVFLKAKNVPSDKEMMIYPSRMDVTIRCNFPFVEDLSQVSFYIDYNDFISSKSGKCLPYPENLPDGVLDYTYYPEVFECVVNEK